MKTDLKERARQQLDRWKEEKRMPTVAELVTLQQYAIREFIEKNNETANKMTTAFLKDIS